MSATASAAGYPRRRGEVLPLIGHHAWWVLMILNVGFYAAAVVFIIMNNGEPIDFDRPTSPTWFLSPILWIWTAIVVFNIWLSRRRRKHDRDLCEHCIALTPLDPEQAVTEHRRTLLINHWFLDGNHPEETRKRAVTALIILSVLNIGAIAGFFLAAWLPIPLAVQLMSLSWLALSAGLVFPYADEIHRRLYPWCPFCGDDDGWDDGGIPEPSPDPSITKELTS